MINKNNISVVTKNKKKQNKEKVKVAVCAVILDENYRLLSVSRRNNLTDYGLIGGKVDGNELLIEALVREVKEETGLDVLKHSLLWERKDGEYQVFTFIVQAEGTLVSEDSCVLRWMSEEELNLLMSGSFGQYNKQLFEYIIDNQDKIKIDFSEYISTKIRSMF